MTPVDTIPEPLVDLLMHVLDRDPITPSLAVVTHDGGYGIALVLDGWYATRELAEQSATGWDELLGEAQTLTREGSR